MKDLSPQAKLFLKAADIVREQGWCQGAIRDSLGRVCFVGALIQAGGGYNKAEMPNRATKILGGPPSTLNDKFWTSPQDCIDALTRCALEYDRVAAP